MLNPQTRTSLKLRRGKAVCGLLLGGLNVFILHIGLGANTYAGLAIWLVGWFLREDTSPHLQGLALIQASASIAPLVLNYTVNRLASARINKKPKTARVLPDPSTSKASCRGEVTNSRQVRVPPQIGTARSAFLLTFLNLIVKPAAGSGGRGNEIYLRLGVKPFPNA